MVFMHKEDMKIMKKHIYIYNIYIYIYIYIERERERDYHEYAYTQYIWMDLFRYVCAHISSISFFWSGDDMYIYI